jgi:hypothetical protein
MWRYARRALPWGLVGVVAVLLVVLLVAVRLYAWTLWPLEGVAVGLLAGAVGWCLDEPAAVVVDATPRGLAWRTTARLVGVALLLTAWSVGVWLARDELFGHPWVVFLQGPVAAAVAAAWVTARRVAGEATPGQRWAVAVVPLMTAWALVRPFPRVLPVLPYGFDGSGGDWRASTVLWASAGVTCLGVLARLLLRERQR